MDVVDQNYCSTTRCRKAHVDRSVHDGSESTPGCHLYRAGQRSQAARCCRCTLLDREGDADLHQGDAIVAVDPPLNRNDFTKCCPVHYVETGCARRTGLLKEFQMSKIAWIGLGHMGVRMSRNMVQAGHPFGARHLAPHGKPHSPTVSRSPIRR